MTSLKDKLIDRMNSERIPILLWIDDIRDPETPYWQKWITDNFGNDKFDIIWVKSYDEFVKFVDDNGVPSYLSFDHDLGYGGSGYDCAKYIVNYLQDNDVDIPIYRIQSSNPIGAENIKSLLDNYHKFYIKTHNE